jgi:hypothetical protein
MSKDAHEAGFDATVKMGVVVEPGDEYSILDVTLVIQAKNRTAAPIPLKHPYTLSTVFAHRATAEDSSGPLAVSSEPNKSRKGTHGNPQTMKGVRFENRPPIDAGGSYSWTVNFRRRISAKLEHNVLMFSYPMKIQHRFQGLRVGSHHLECTFTFLKPVRDRWSRFKRYRTFVRDNHMLVTKVEYARRATICHIDPFDISASDPMPLLQFTCIYGFPRLWTHILTSLVTILGTIAVEVAGKLMLEHFIGW